MVYVLCPNYVMDAQLVFLERQHLLSIESHHISIYDEYLKRFFFNHFTFERVIVTLEN